MTSPAQAAAPARATATATAAVTITAVGDTMLGSTPDLPPDPAAYLDPVEPVLRQGQIVFGNLEGTLTTVTSGKCGSGSKPHPDCFAFRDPPSYARDLKAAGFTVLNDANNHSFDFGAAGQAQTVRSIHAAGLAQTGLPGEITRVRAGQVTVAFVAFAPYPYTASLLRLPAARALIERARRQAQLVVVYMHAGAEGAAADHVTGREENYLGEDRGNPEAFAHMAIDAGASLVTAADRVDAPSTRLQPGRCSIDPVAGQVACSAPWRSWCRRRHGQGVTSRRMQTRGQRSRPSAISCARISRSPGVISASSRTRNPHRS